VLSYIKRLSDAGISLCGQIVLCKGINDGEELDRSLRDLSEFFPAMQSVSIVPAGLTKYREKLYPLEVFSPAECAAVIEQVNAYGNWCLKEYGTRIFYCSDEFYVRAGLPLPPEEFYEDYSQIENGVGMLTSMKAEFDMELDYLDELLADFRAPRTVSVITGMAAYEHISSLASELEEKVDGLTVTVYPIVNKFFGESVTVAGLITGGDVVEQLSDKELGDELLFPSVMLRADGDVFLDDMTPDELGTRLDVPVRAVESDGAKFIAAVLGIGE
jgi:putative radical SAM enzyme (TIGR03279 family)